MLSNLEQVARIRERNQVTMEIRTAIKQIPVPRARNNASYMDMIIYGMTVPTIHTQVVLQELTSQLFMIANVQQQLRLMQRTKQRMTSWLASLPDPSTLPR